MDINDIKTAQTRIAPYVKRTPLEHSNSLSKHLGTNVYVKYELFQKTGSFKPRGAFNKLLSMEEHERGNGVVAVSGCVSDKKYHEVLADDAQELGLGY